MTCPNCRQTSIFKQKLGRCQRCMNQLAVLSPLSWGVWWLVFSDTPKEMGSITLLFAAVAFTLLLAAHLLVKWIVIPLKR